MKNLTVLKRIFVLAALAITVMAGALIYKTYASTDAIIAERKVMLVGMNDVAISLMKKYYALEQAGTLTREEAQKSALADIMTLRYGKEGYFWVNDFDGVMVAHAAKPAMNGTNQLDLKDPNGKFIFRDMIAIAKKDGQGYVDYLWPKPGFDEPVQKYSHIASFKPWNYLVGNGVYGDDIAAIQRAGMWQSGLILLGAALLNILCAIWIGRSISQPLNRLKTVMGEVADNNVDSEVPHTDRRDEIGEIAGALVKLRGSVIERQALEQGRAEQQRTLDESRAEAEALTSRSAAEQQAVVKSFAGAFEALSRGDLTVRIANLPGEYHKLGEDFNQAIGQLCNTFAEVAGSTQTLTQSIDEINAAVSQLSSRTESQAASLEETAAAISEITKTINQSGSNVNHARSLAGEAKADASASGEVVSRAIAAMSRIEGSSTKINEIISVIDEIAFQTNLLALNAGVEAARAGEAGKGFAVVAQEVRELAQRSATAAKEIKTLISESSAQVEAGVQLVEETGKSLSGIDGRVISINDAIGAVATLSQEQSAAIGEINSAISQIDQTTQHNAAMVEETTAATMTLAAEAQRLYELLAVFKIATDTRGQGRMAA